MLSLALALTLALPVLDAAGWAELEAASRAGFELPAVSDAARYGRADVWVVADATGGDCEDKALSVRAALIAAGWPATALRVALAWTEAREYHAVLTVDVARDGRPATYVIDSRFPWVIGWDTLSRFGYRWDRRQGAGGGWTRITP